MKPISPNQDNITILMESDYEISEFAEVFQPVFARHLLGERRRRPFCRLSICEIMTILIAYQIIGGQNSENFYKDVIWQFHRKEFPCLVTYQRFVEIAPIALMPLLLFPEFRMEMSDSTGICVIDSTPPRGCPNLRIPDTRFSETLPGEAKVPQDGSADPSFIWSSVIRRAYVRPYQCRQPG